MNRLLYIVIGTIFLLLAYALLANLRLDTVSILMKLLILVFLIFASYFLRTLFFQKDKSNYRPNNAESDEEEMQNYNTRERVLNALKEIGSQPEIGPNDNRIAANYQGVEFNFWAWDNLHNICIVTDFGYLDLNNEDIPIFKEEINKCNMDADNKITLLYIIEQKQQRFRIWGKYVYDIAAIAPEANTRVIISTLDNFIATINLLRQSIIQAKSMPQQPKERVVIKGFSNNKK